MNGEIDESAEEDVADAEQGKSVIERDRDEVDGEKSAADSRDIIKVRHVERNKDDIIKYRM